MWTIYVPLGDRTLPFVRQDLHQPPPMLNREFFTPSKLTLSLFDRLKRGLHKNASFFFAAVVSKLVLFLFLNFLLPKIVAIIA